MGSRSLFFFVSKVLKGLEFRYFGIEKLVFALLLVVRKFKVYLNNHQCVVRMDQPLWRIFHRLETSGRILVWLIEIGPYCLQYSTIIKA